MSRDILSPMTFWAKMNGVLLRAFRWWSPLRYARWSLARERQNHRAQIHASNLTGTDLENFNDQLAHERQEWEYWILEMEDSKLVARANKMDVHLDDIPLPAEENSHYEFSPMANEILHTESRKAVRKAMRERAPNYRREKREVWLLWITLISAIGGLFGGATGLIAVLRKH
jgi:hypothetical protein